MNKEILKIFPKQTVIYLRHLSGRIGKDEKELYAFAYIILLKCRKKFNGDEKLFYRYLNTSIKHSLINSYRKKNISFTSLNENIEDFGYEQPFNDEINDFRKFVKKNCSPQAHFILKMCLDQPLKMRLYCHRNRNSTKSEVLLMLTYLQKNHSNIFRTVSNGRKYIRELKNARHRYNSL